MNPYQNLKKANPSEVEMQTLQPLADKIILVNMDRGEKVSHGGVIVLDDTSMDVGERGIRARWAQVYAVGPEQIDVKRGDWILMEHGRWSENQTINLGGGPFKFWLGDPNGILGISDSQPAGMKIDITIE
jgi:co-chaperonin GroES (HSP10)